MLPSTCPVCEHTPLSATDCNPNKVMRSTIRVFIKTELKKRETTRAKQTKDAQPVAPALATPVEAFSEQYSQSTVTDGVAAIAVGEAQGTGTSSFSSKPLDNAPSRAEDSQMQESGHVGARQEDAPDSNHNGSDGAVTNGNNISVGPTDHSVRNSHFSHALLKVPTAGVRKHVSWGMSILLTCRNHGKR